MDFDFSPVESLDKVPAQFKPLYVDKPGEDGKFAVNPAFTSVAEAVNGFNKSNKTLREQIKGFKPTDLSALAEFGETPEAIAEAIKTRLTEAAGTKGVEVTKQVEAAKAALVDAHKKELEKREQRANALQTQLFTLLVDNAATTAIADLKGVPELLLPFIRTQVKVVEENGHFKPQVIDAAGEVRYGATGSPMTIRELVEQMKSEAKYGRLFESETPAGGGKPPGSGRTPAPKPGQRELSSNEKIAAGLAKRGR